MGSQVWGQKSNPQTYKRRKRVAQGHVIGNVEAEVAVVLARRNTISIRNIIKDGGLQVDLLIKAVGLKVRIAAGQGVRTVRKRRMRKRMRVKVMKMLSKYRSVKRRHYRGSLKKLVINFKFDTENRETS